jgi:hypothetical protein
MIEKKTKHLYIFLATYLNHVLKFVDLKKKIDNFFGQSHWSCNRILSKFCNGENFHPKKEGYILSNFMQHNGTCIKTSKLSNLNKAWKWLLIAFCFENVFFTNCNDTQKKFFLASFKPWANRTYIGLITSTWVSKSTNQK